MVRAIAFLRVLVMRFGPCTLLGCDFDLLKARMLS
jgi:hypothetical protein